MAQIPALTEKQLRRYEIKAENMESGAKEIYEKEMQAQYGFYYKAIQYGLYPFAAFFILTMIVLLGDSINTNKPQYHKIWIGEVLDGERDTNYAVFLVVLDVLWMVFIVAALYFFYDARRKGPYKTKDELLYERVELQDLYGMVQEPRLKF